MGRVHGHRIARRPPGATALRHGEAEPLGQTFAERPGERPRGYDHLFAKTKHQLDDETVEELANLMRARRNTSAGTPYIPAGYTYLGQFIDHDITFDASSHRAPATAPENFRTPRLDLDSLYGSGPVVHPFLYDWEHPDAAGARLLLGRNPEGGHEDLPRNLPGRALIGDARNDENAIIAQLHLLFIKFHNAVLDRLPDRDRHWEELFKQAREVVRWHYQWIVRYEFLPKILGPELTERVIEEGLWREVVKQAPEPFVPLEFSVGAFRFGHSLVRDQYHLTRDEAAPPLRLFPDLEGLRRLDAKLVLDWTLFFRFQQLGYQYEPQNGFEIDSGLSGPLFALPDGGGSLAERNLKRANILKVPSGQEVRLALKEVAEGLELKELDERALHLEGLQACDRLLKATPLWYYILCEAEQEGGDHLGPLGGLLVAGVILSLLESDPTSFMAVEGWKPFLGVEDPHEFRMTDLIQVAAGPIV